TLARGGSPSRPCPSASAAGCRSLHAVSVAATLTRPPAPVLCRVASLVELAAPARRPPLPHRVAAYATRPPGPDGPLRRGAPREPPPPASADSLDEFGASFPACTVIRQGRQRHQPLAS